MAVTIEQRRKALQSGAGTAAGLTIEQRRAALGGKAIPKKGEIFSGGLFSDIIDGLQAPQFIATGLLSKEFTVGEALKHKISPSVALGLGPVTGFLADVVLDPINFISGLGLTSKGLKTLKAGTKATTLGGQAVKGQRAALNFVVPFTDISVPIVKGEAALKGLTRAGEAVKSVPVAGKNIGKILSETFGVLPATGKNTISAIEATAKKTDTANVMLKGVERAMRQAGAEAVERLRPMAAKLERAVKSNAMSADELAKLADNMEAFKSGLKPKHSLSKAANDIFTGFKPAIKEAQEIISKALPDELANKGFTNILLPEFRAKGAGVGAKVLARQEGVERFGEYSTIGGKIARTTKTKGERLFTQVVDGKKVVVKEKVKNVDGRWFKAEDANRLQVIDFEKSRLGAQIQDLAGELDRLPKKTKSAATKSSKLRKASRLKSLTKKIKNLSDEATEISASKSLKRTGANAPDIRRVLEDIGEESPFSENVVERLLATQIQGKRAIVRQRATDAVKQNPSLVRELARGEKIPDGFRALKIPELKGFVAEGVVADAMEKTFFGYSQLGPLEDALRGWNEVQNTLKKVLTFVNIAFHSRNAVTNTWVQTMLAGTKPTEIAEGYRLMWKATRLRSKGVQGKALAKALGKHGEDYLEFVDEALGGTGQFFGDIERSLKKQNWAFEWGGAVGNYLEDAAKLGTFMGKKKAGFTKAAAAQEVRKFLFDYSDLTDVERVLFKSAFPFYTWSRKNIPMQMAMLVQNPKQVSILGKAKSAVESMVEGEPLDDRLMPDWMRDGYNVFLGERPDGIANYLRLEGFLPTVDLTKVARPGEFALESLSPLIKTPIEIFSNYDFFFNKQIKDYEGQRKEVFGLDIPVLSTPAGRKVFDLIRPAKDIERVIGLRESDKGKDIELGDRLMRFLGGINIQNLNASKQEDVLEFLITKEKSKLKKELKTANRNKDRDKAKEILKLIRKIESGETEISL